MSTNFPAAIDAFQRSTSADSLASSSGRKHSLLHDDAFDAIEALENRIGITGSTNASSLTWFRDRFTMHASQPAGSLQFNSGGQLGIRTAPSAWSAAMYAVQFPRSAMYDDNAGGAGWTANGYFNGASWIRLATAANAAWYTLAGDIIFRQAASGTAGTAVTWSETVRINLSAAGSVARLAVTTAAGARAQTWTDGVNATGLCGAFSGSVFAFGADTGASLALYANAAEYARLTTARFRSSVGFSATGVSDCVENGVHLYFDGSQGIIQALQQGVAYRALFYNAASHSWGVSGTTQMGLDANGTFQTNRSRRKAVSRFVGPGTDTCDYADHVCIAFTSGGAVTLNLPAAPANGDEFEFVVFGANSLTIARNGKVIDGAAANLVLTSGQRARLVYSNTDGSWFRMSS